MDEELSKALALEGLYDTNPPDMAAMAEAMAAAQAGGGAGGGSGEEGIPGAGAGAPSPLTPELIKRWTSIYPCYINPDRKASQGRRVSKEQLTDCHDPHVFDIAHAALALGFAQGDVAIENMKRHPRDPFCLGRVRIHLLTADGAPRAPGITNKAQLLAALARALPHTDARKHRLAQMAHARAEHMKQQAAAQKGMRGGAKPSPAKASAAAGAGGKVEAPKPAVAAPKKGKR